MERLNNIMGRTPQRRHANEQRPANSNAPMNNNTVMGPRPPSSHLPPPITRRPMPEQSSQMGQRSQYGSRQQYQARTQNQRPQQRLTGQEDASFERPGNSTYGYESRRPLYPPQPGTVNSVTAYPARQRPPMEDIAPSTQGTPGAGYYQADDYRPPVRADVTEEWDDDGGMLYGDWEENDEELIYEREDNETPVNSQHRPYYAGEVPMPSIESSRRGYPTHTTHDLSTRNLPIAAPQAQAVPSRVYEESQRYQRTTQPLNSQALMRLDREQLRQGAPTGIAPQPQRTRQPGRQEMVPATSTRLAPMAKQKTACPHCHGAGFLRSDVPFGHPNFGKPVPCACKEAERKERRRQQLRDMSNLDSFRDKSFNTFNSRVPGVAEAFEYCRVYAQSPDGWLLLVGVNGSGKTHLALAIANQCLDSGSVVLFSVVPDLLDHLRAAFAPTSEEIYDQLFAKMREAEVLVLDDLGAQQSSSWASEKLFQLLNYRYNMGMPTVITANPKGLQGIDERIRSRLSDNNLVTRLNFERAQDYRPHHPRRAAR